MQALLQDKEGRIRITTRNGLNCLNPAMATFWTYQPNPGQMTEAHLLSCVQIVLTGYDTLHFTS